MPDERRTNSEAIDTEKALREQPDSPDARFNLGIDLMRLPGREHDAETQLKAALRLEPNHEQAHNSLALLLVKPGRNEALFRICRPCSGCIRITALSRISERCWPGYPAGSRRHSRTLKRLSAFIRTREERR